MRTEEPEMSRPIDVPSQQENDITTGPDTKLAGNMGVFGVFASVLACAAPVAVVSGFIPLIIAFGGAGAPLVFLVVMVLMLIFSVGLTAMSRYLAKAGGFYSYVTAGLGKASGLGAAFLATYGYVSVGFATLPFLGFSTDSLMTSVFGLPHIDWYWYALIGWALGGILAALNIDVSAKALVVAMVLEVVIVLVFDAGVLFHGGGPEGVSLSPFSWGAFSEGSIGLGLLFGVLCIYGFESTVIYSEEVREPRKTIPRATYLSVVFICLFHVLASWMLVTAFGRSKAMDAANADLGGMFSGAMQTYVGKAGKDIALVLVVTSIFAALVSVQNVSSRYVYSLGHDRVFPRYLGRVHPRLGSPFNAAVTISAIWGLLVLLFAVIGTDPSLVYARMSGLSSFVAIVLYLLVSVAIIAFFRKSTHIKDATVWHRFIAPGLSVVGFGAITYLGVKNLPLLIGGSATFANSLLAAVVGIFVVGVVMARYFRVAKPEIYAAIGRQGS